MSLSRSPAANEPWPWMTEARALELILEVIEGSEAAYFSPEAEAREALDFIRGRLSGRHSGVA